MARFHMHGRWANWHRRLPSLPATVAATLFFCSCLIAPVSPANDGVRTLRVLKLKHHELNHPHRDAHGEFRMLADFARRHGLRIEWLDAYQPGELHRRLVNGEGDILVADLPPGLASDPRLQASVPMGAFRYHVIGRADNAAKNPLELNGYRIAVRLSSPMWSYFNRLTRALPGVIVVVLPVDTSRAAMLQGTTDGRYDAAVIAARPDENPIEYLPQLKALFELSELNAMNWYFLRDRRNLKLEVDGYIQRFHASFLAPDIALGDLDAIKKRRVLRVITRMDPQNYFVRGGRHAGFEYELARLFTRQHQLDIEFLVGETDQQIMRWLRSGVGDLVTTRVNTRDVSTDPELNQSRDYFHSASVIISRRGNSIRHPKDLAGKRVAVLANTIHHRTLGKLVAAGTSIEPVIISPDTPLDRVIDQLENWVIDAAIIDAYAVDDIRKEHPLIQAGASLPVQFNYAWTMRTSNPELQSAVDQFLRDQFRMETYNVLARRYFGRSRFVQFTQLAHISPYDVLVRRHADTYDFDWRLIVAQMYQESHFNPGAQSEAGACGLMQLLPGTANDMGVADPFDPESGIRGGVKYLRYLWDRFDEAIAPRERTWFALAAYNIGFNRIDLARQRARDRQLDPNRWFGHVEQAMRTMATDGTPCKCGQTVVYVRAIRSLYNTYHRLHDALTAGLGSEDSAPAI